MTPGPEKITSPQNPKIKALKKLEKASERKAQQLILIEGMRETVIAYRSGYEIVSFFICEEILKKDHNYDFKELVRKVRRTPYGDSLGETRNLSVRSKGLPVETPSEKFETVHISKNVYDSLAYRETTEGIIATARPKKLSLDNLKLSAAPLILVIEAVEKPGNLGAMLRTCDAAGVDAVIICDPKTDVYNPNVIRSSIGTIFTNQLAICETQEAIEFFKNKKIKTFAAELNAKKFHYEQNFKQASAIVVGAEATGLSNEWLKAADEKIKIPMQGKIDSLNVSVSAGVLLFEARRQRSVGL